MVSTGSCPLGFHSGFRFLRLWLVGSCLVGSWVVGSGLGVGCGDEGAAVDGGATSDGARPDGGGPIGVPCADDSDCGDGIACTQDVCDASGVCRNLPDPGICQDGVFCNGVEICDPMSGCEPGDAACNDDDVCTVPACDEEERQCQQLPRDADGDGEADWHCPGGTDCDDRDPTRGMSFSELCGDAVDNDCDDQVDEAECGRPDHDVCEDALDVSSEGAFTLDSAGATPDYPTSCAGTRRDLVTTFSLSEAQALRLSADGQSVTAIEVRSTCDDGTSAVECGSGFPAELRVRSLDPGTYYAIISDASPGELSFEVEFSEPTPAPTNQTCAGSVDLGAGGATVGGFVDVTDDYRTGCGPVGASDLVYEFTTAVPQNVEITLVSRTGDALAYAVRTTCDDAETELRCTRGDPAVGTFFELPAGRYFLIVEGAFAREVDFDLTLRVAPPTPPPDGETCVRPLTLPLNTMVTGTLVGRQDDHETVCGFSYRDAVYRFTLVEQSDITVTVDGEASTMRASVRSVCDAAETRFRCESGDPALARLRNLPPGEYFVLVEAFGGAAYTVSVATFPPTVPTPVSGNDTCEGAIVVPEAGGLFVGTTVGASDSYQTRAGCGSMATSPDVAFRLDLTAPKRVVASTEGSAFDTVLHLHAAECMSNAEEACDEDGGAGLTSVLSRTLGAGTHYFVIDGFGSSSFGDYVFQVTLSDP